MSVSRHLLVLSSCDDYSNLISRFSPADTNLILREFEKCGVILKHVPGPRDANWMHILYQVLSLLLLRADIFDYFFI